MLFRNPLLRAQVARSVGAPAAATDAQLHQLLKIAEKRRRLNQRSDFSRSDSIQSLPHSCSREPTLARRACSVSESLHVVSTRRSERRSAQILSFEDFKRRSKRPQSIQLKDESSTADVTPAETRQEEGETTPTNCDRTPSSCGDASDESETLHETANDEAADEHTEATPPAMSTLPFDLTTCTESEAEVECASEKNESELDDSKSREGNEVSEFSFRILLILVFVYLTSSMQFSIAGIKENSTH